MSHKHSSVVVLLALVVNGALYGQRRADFSTLVVAGDSLTAGYQNAQLIESGQVHGYANVIASQAGVSLNLPLLPPPGYPQVTIEQNYAVLTGLTPVARLNTQQTRDVAVPGFSVAALVGLQASCPPDFTNPVEVLAAEILNPNCAINPGPTQLEEAVSLKPTTSILWIGSNDVLFSILYGTPLTDVPTFSGLYHLAATTLAAGSGHLVLANVPDVTLVPYLASVPTLATTVGLPIPLVEHVFGLQPGDKVTPYAFQLIEAMGTSLTTLPDSIAQGPVIIRTAELAQIRATVRAYNAEIANEAAASGATLVDIYALVNDLAANGIVVGGQRLTTDFMGGLFSLDGIHPTDTGYAIIANEFIRAMDRSFGAGIPPTSVEQVSKTDPLIFPESGGDKPGRHVSVGMAECLRLLHGR